MLDFVIFATIYAGANFAAYIVESLNLYQGFIGVCLGFCIGIYASEKDKA